MYALKKNRWSSFILQPEEATLETAGGKGHNLFRLRCAGFDVPDWIVIAPSAFWTALSATDRMALRAATSSSDAAKIASRAVMPGALAAAIEGETFRIFCRTAKVAVRSSAIDEDGATHSFAGQLDSFLNAGTQSGAIGIAEAVLKVWLSSFSERNLVYRQTRGLSLVPQPPAVLIQRMIDADCAGVAFSAEPVSGRRSVAVVNAVKGLGDALVSGAVNGDVFYVDKAGSIISESRAEVSSELSREQAAQLAGLVRKAEAHFIVPQDMEWAIADEKIFVLQARPITKLGSAETPIIWDNSNIGESYQGVTTPLTFSFARKAYEHVYIQFCRMMGVPETRISANAHVFPHMIGFVNGRIYYNLLNWYRLISILPGYKTNRLFMEQMMGVSQTLPPDLVAEIAAENQTEGMSDRINLVFSLLKSAAHFATLQTQIDSFNHRFESALALIPDDLNGQSLEQLSKLYRGLEQSLLPNWDAPLTNDWFAMIFYGVLKQLCKKWCGDTDGTMQNALLCNMSGIISAVPAQRMREMALTASTDSALLDALHSDDLEKMLAAISQNSNFERQYRSYISQFGDRCLGELKLESSTLRDDPLPLLRAVAWERRSWERRLSAGTEKATEDETRPSTSSTAETQAYAAIGNNAIKRALFSFVLANARERVRQRENLRFHRTRLFGTVRRIFTAVGARLQEAKVLEQSSDIFFLEVAEIFGCLDGAVTTANLKSLVSLRRGENARYQLQAAPPDRFETRGPVTTSVPAPRSTACGELGDTNTAQLSGLGCCPGRVVGPVRVMRNPHLSKPLVPGEIVVAERTDPGWILVFPQAAGLLVEYGSLLSHSAIVSRELGLPAIVSIKGVTSWLQDGDIVEMDGATGIVRKLESKQ